MQSDGHSFCGEVVLDSLKMSYREEGSILDRKYGRQIFWYVYYEDYFTLRVIEENAYLKKYST